jgi:hypothetical protein
MRYRRGEKIFYQVPIGNMGGYCVLSVDMDDDDAAVV